MSFALSTSWNAFRHKNAKGMLFEIKGLGFQEVELSFNLTFSMVKEAAKIHRDGQIKVVSVHNFCPIPQGLKREVALPDYYAMSSLYEKERALSVKYAKKSIDTAQELGAKAVVLHCGRVQMPDKTRSLIALYAAGAKGSKEFRDLKSAMQKERRRQAQPFLENTLRSLGELSGYAGKRNVSLGIETRFYYREIPSLEEIGIILREFKGANLFYWHDTGHAQLMEDLGFWRQREYLELYGSKIMGLHLHDISVGCDHRPPGKGEIDFRFLKKHLNRAVLKVLEIHHPATADEVRKAREYLTGLFDG